MAKINEFIKEIGWPRVIIALFLVSLFAATPFVQVRLDRSISDTLIRLGMNAVMVLAMVPMIQTGCGLNFGLPLGIVAGLLGAVLAIEIGVTGIGGFLTALFISCVFGVLFGYGYALILNKVKGDEMTIATYVGFSSVAFMCIMWLLLPLRSPNMIWGYGGSGLRTTISLEGYWLKVLDNFLAVTIGEHFTFPTGALLFDGLICLFIWGFFKTKTGTALTAVGSNPDFARASGIDADKMRTISVILSTCLGAVGILVYQQSFGFIQLYMGPLFMGFPAVAAILIGGASLKKASIANVIIGTILFQGILTMTPSVINSLIQSDMSEVIRVIVSNGMIVYALTRQSR